MKFFLIKDGRGEYALLRNKSEDYYIQEDSFCISQSPSFIIS